MFKIDNEKIGDYVSKLIDVNYESTRKFCKEYIKVDRGKKVDEDELRNMENRLSQIKKGNKAIQIHDLPIFSELLDISFEQMLSAGKCGAPKNRQMTNFTIAQSHSRKMWRTYIEKEEQPILNPDEYGKNVLDYAIEFDNYDFIKFLLDEKYIWFDIRKEDDYCFTFGAGTSIACVVQIDKLKVYDQPSFGAWLGEGEWKYKLEDALRKWIISSAADRNDLKMLEQLRAREIPELYYRVHYADYLRLDIAAHYQHDKAMVKHIAESSEEVLDYFTDAFEIQACIKYKNGSESKYTFVFPYISKLLDMLIENNSSFLQKALEKAIAYNEGTLKKLKASTVIESDDWRNYDGLWEKMWKEDIYFQENGDIVELRGLYIHNTSLRIITNVIHATKKSKDEQINGLIEKLNESYNRIRNISEEGFT